MQPHVQSFFDLATYTVTYVMADPATHTCAITDPVWDYDPKSGCSCPTSAPAVPAA